jgi:hypothetical protein
MKGALALLCLLLVVPLLLVDIPPLLDYPNHLARAVVLAFDDPVLRQMYTPHWAIIPDLGTDLVLPPLLHVLPVYVAGRIIIAAAVLLPVIGTFAYSRAVFGTRSLWPLASALVAYNGTLLLGFLNFVAGAGLALLLAAAWIAWRERYPVRIIALATVGAVALFFCHLMSLIFCTILIGAHELGWLWQRRGDARAATRRIALSAVPLLAPLALYTQSPLSPVAIGLEWPSLDDKLRELVMPFANYLLPLDIATAVAVVGFAAICALVGRCRVTLGSGIALVVTTVLFVMAPNAVKGTYLFDTRFVIMLGFLLFGAVLPVPQPRFVALGLALLFAARMTVLGVAWWEQRQDVAEIRTTIASVQPGERVVLAFVTRKDAPAYWRDAPMNRHLSLGLPLYYHLPALLLIEHRAFWPYLFDDPSQQPIEALPPYRDLAERVSGFVDYRRLAEADGVNLCGFDGVLVIGAGGAKDLARFASENLQMVAATDIAALFRVGPTACGVPVAGR